MTGPSYAWQSRKGWRDALVRPVVPEGEGPTSPLSIRFPKKVIERLDEVAKATGNDRSTVILHLVRWGLEEFDRQRLDEERRRKNERG